MTTLALVAGHKEHKHPFPRHPECQHLRCARHADREWAKHHRRPAPEWAIPAEIVRCESTYTNDPPNEAGAAGYYQLTEWPEKSAGLPVGHGGFANEHSKREQGIVARHLYDEQGTGPWVSSEPCWGGRI